MNGTVADIPLAYWHCHSELPYGVQVASSVVSLLLSLLVVNSAFGAAFNFSHMTLKGMFNKVEKRAIIFQYLVTMPLFEVFVIWGPDWTDAITRNSTSSVVAWLAVNCLSVVLVILSFFALHRYRMLIHVAQCMRAPTAVMFFCDRIINFSIGVEGVFIGGVFVCSMFELFHVHRFLTPARKHVPLLDIPPDRPLVPTPSTPTHESERAHRAETVYKDTPPPAPAPEPEFDPGVPMSVQNQLRAKERHQRAAVALNRISNLRGNESARTLKRIVEPLRRPDPGNSVSSGSVSERAPVAAADDDTALSDF
jgi:hypothetical protein